MGSVSFSAAFGQRLSVSCDVQAGCELRGANSELAFEPRGRADARCQMALRSGQRALVVLVALDTFDAKNTHTTHQPESGAAPARFLVRQHERRRGAVLGPHEVGAKVHFKFDDSAERAKPSPQPSPAGRGGKQPLTAR
jgi:hypothetical protein